MIKLNKFHLFAALTCVYAVFIFYLSSLASPPDPSGFGFLFGLVHLLEDFGFEFLMYPFYVAYRYPDKFAHMLLYLGFGLLLNQTLSRSKNDVLSKYGVPIALGLGTFYALTDEIHQAFVPYRTASSMDLFADFIGLLLAQLLILTYFGIKNIRESREDKSALLSHDLGLVLLFAFLAYLSVLVPPFDQTLLLRIVFALPLLLFLSGYVLIAAMFPRKDELSVIERFPLSIELSIGIFVFDGFAISVTPWLFRPAPIIYSLTLITITLMVLTLFVRLRITEEERFSFHFAAVSKFFESLRTPDEKPSNMKRALVVALVGSIIIAGGMLIYAKVTFEEERFTTFYIFGEGGKAENYPTEVYLSEPSSMIVGIENHEHATANYTLQVILGGYPLHEQQIMLADGEKWGDTVFFTPKHVAKHAKLEFLLYKDDSTNPYRSVHLWVDVRIAPFEEITKEVATSFYVLDANGTEENYPTALYLGEPAEVLVGIENNEHETVNYTLQVKLDGKLLQSEDVRLEDGSKWEQKISFTPNQLGALLKLEFLLFKDRVKEEPYKAFHLLVSSDKDHDILVSSDKDHDNVVSPPPAEILTPFSILDAEGTEEYYPTELHLGEPEEVLIRVENKESKEINYILQTKLDGRVVTTRSKWLTHGSKWEQKISFTPSSVGDNQTLEFLLFKDSTSGNPYRYFYRWVSTELNYGNLEPLLRYGIQPLPRVKDGDMRRISAWTFDHNGSFRDSPYSRENTSSRYSYGIKQYGASNKGDYGELWQTIYAQNEGVAVLSFNVRDSYEYTSDAAENITKQVLFNDEVIWVDDVSGRDTGYTGWVEEEYNWYLDEWKIKSVPRVKSGWKRIEVPVYLFKGNNKLSLMVIAEEAAEELQVTVYWDDVELKRINDLVRYDEGVRMKRYG